MLLTSSILFSEFFLIIASGVLLAFVALKPAKISSLSIISHNLSSYSFLVAALLLLQVMDISFTDPLIVSNPLIVTVKILIVLSAGIFTFLMRRGGALQISEFGLLTIMGIVGLMIIVSSNDLLVLYLGLELQSLTMYILATIKRNGEFSTEAGFKYFILGAVSSGLFLLGCAYTYFLCGHTGYSALADMSYASPTTAFPTIGYILILIALLWKIGAAPLHMWVPDVYEGAPHIVSAFFAIIPKLGVVTALIILLSGPMFGSFEIQALLITSAIISLLIGSIGALNQSKLKRVLAYSAISHTGFLLAGLSTGSIEGLIATLIYNILYVVMAFNTFTIVSNVLPSSANYNNLLIGLSRNNKLLALNLALVLLSLAGVPPLAGFVSKYFVLVAAFNSNLYLLTGFAILSSVISAFFYLSLVKKMYFKDKQSYNWKVLADISTNYYLTINTPVALILSASLFIIISALVYPQPLINIATDAILLSLQ